jgi:hypothetical protein
LRHSNICHSATVSVARDRNRRLTFRISRYGVMLVSRGLPTASPTASSVWVSPL